MNAYRQAAKEFEYFVLLIRGAERVIRKRNQENSPKSKLMKRYLEEAHMALNKVVFEENWKTIRGQSTARWSLMADFDLNKVDKAEVKFDKFVTMLQVKYGYTRQQAREEIGKFWAEHEAKDKAAK
jgi:hypothetical protein